MYAVMSQVKVKGCGMMMGRSAWMAKEREREREGSGQRTRLFGAKVKVYARETCCKQGQTRERRKREGWRRAGVIAEENEKGDERDKVVEERICAGESLGLCPSARNSPGELLVGVQVMDQ
jgi:hypothetical protein